MCRILRGAFGLLFLCANACCDRNGGQSIQDHGQVETSGAVSLVLSSSPDHPRILGLTLANASNHPALTLETNGIPELTMFASQGDNRVIMDSKAHWKLMMIGAAYGPFRRIIPPNGNVQYSLDLSDYLDRPEPRGSALPNIRVFDHKQAVNVWVTMANTNKQGAGPVDRISNSVSIRLDQW
jgi:hypothetical protein